MAPVGKDSAPRNVAKPEAEMPRVEDNSTAFHPETEKHVQEAINTTEVQETPNVVNPAHNPGDNLALNQTLTENPLNLPASGTGAHCGYCGQQVSPEGVHFDGNGFVATAGHANTMVIADNWPHQVAEQDAKNAAEVKKETLDEHNARIAKETREANETRAKAEQDSK